MKWSYHNVVWLLCLIWAQTFVEPRSNVCDPPKRVSDLTGDVIIGGLIPVHADNPLKLNEPGIMWVEAMMYAIKEINENRSLLPNLKLGYDIRDSCNQVDVALGATLDFLLSPDMNNNTSWSYATNNNINNSVCVCNRTTSFYPPVVAIVGGASSRISATVSPLFSVDNIPQISYSSTSPSLSEKLRHRSFLRTIPSDVYQAKAIADILVYFNWTYVSVVVSDDEYGRNGLIALRSLLKEKHICVAVETMFATSSVEDMQRDSASIVRKLQEYQRSSVVVLWCERPKAINFLKIATGKLFNVTWIGTESWGDNIEVKNTIDFNLIGGMLGVLPFLGRHRKFDEHLKSLTPKTVHSDANPWLDEYWSQKKFSKCVENLGSCSSKGLLPSAALLPPNKYANVMDAVYAIAHGLHSLMLTNPNNFTVNKEILGELLKHVKEVNFRALSGNGAFMFTDTGDPEYGAYLIKNLQGNRTTKGFVTVGQWDDEKVENRLKLLTKDNIQWNTGVTSTPLSRCSEKCQPGFYFVKTSKECCWKCVKCQEDFFKDKVANTDCKPCSKGYISNSNRTGCVELDEDFLKWDSVLSIVAFVASLLGFVLIVFVIVVFRKYSTTAVVKASNRELSMIHLICHALIFMLPLLYIGRPSDVICILRSYFFSILFTIIISIMFLKTDRIVRIFNSKRRLTQRSHLLSNQMQFVLTFIMVCIPVAGTTIWILLQPPRVTTERFYSRGDKFVVFCGTEAGVLHLIQLSFILLLALLCTYEAYQARRLPESFNEAKYICFSTFGFVLMWAGYIPGYMDTVGSTKQFMTCLFALLTNFTMVSLIYVPKLRIILFQPQRNRHEAFRKATLNACLQEVLRLSPATTPNINKPSIIPASETRSISELTDDSADSREPGNNLNYHGEKPKPKVPSLIVRGQPLYRPKDSDRVPKIRTAISV